MYIIDLNDSRFIKLMGIRAAKKFGFNNNGFNVQHCKLKFFVDK